MPSRRVNNSFVMLAPGGEPNVRRIPAGRQLSGFLSTYANLKPNPNLRARFAALQIPSRMFTST